LWWGFRRIGEEEGFWISGMTTDRNSGLGFTAYDSIHGDQNHYPKQIASFFIKNHSIIFQKSLHGYI